MPVQRRRHIEGRKQQPLARGVGQMILAPQHVTDLHERVIQGIAEKERRAAIGPSNHEIADIVGQIALRAVHQILKLEALTQWHAKAQARTQPLRAPLRNLLLTQIAAGAGIAWRPAGCQLGAPRHVQLQRRAKARVYPPRALELLEVALVDRAAL